jgi:hypothetical protein
VIDWSDTHAAGYYLKTALATRDSKPCFSICAHAQVLSVKGLIVGRIEHCRDSSHILWPDAVNLKRKILARISSPRRAFFASLLRLMECISIVQKMKDTAGTEDELHSIVMDTVNLLTRDLLPPEMWHSLSAEAKSPFSSRLHYMMSAVNEMRREQKADGLDATQKIETLANLWQSIWADVPDEDATLNVKHLAMIIASLGKHERTLVVLDTGHICPVHISCSEGDAIALIAGVDHPMLLRPVANDQYRVICTAWICGAMYGELWPDDELELTQLDII